MSYLDISQAVANASDIDAVPGGEYKVEIQHVTLNHDKGWMHVILVIPDVVSAKDVSLLLNLPGAGRNPKEENINVNRLLEFYRCFGLDPTKPGGYDMSAFYPEGPIGATGWVILSDPRDDGKGYGMQNKVAKFIRRRS